MKLSCLKSHNAGPVFANEEQKLKGLHACVVWSYALVYLTTVAAAAATTTATTRTILLLIIITFIYCACPSFKNELQAEYSTTSVT